MLLGGKLVLAIQFHQPAAAVAVSGKRPNRHALDGAIPIRIQFAGRLR